MSRWEFLDVSIDGFRAKCKQCGRTAVTKEDLAHCPRKCEIVKLPTSSPSPPPPSLFDE